MRRALLLAPLLLLMAAGLLPLANLPRLAVEERDVPTILPATVAALAAWDGADLPADAAFEALARDLRLAPLRPDGPATLARAAARLDALAPGLADAIPDTARRLADTAIPPAAALLLAHPAWERRESWAALRVAAGPVAPTRLLAALDLRREADGTLASAEAPERRRALRNTLRRAAGATLLALLLGIPLAAAIAAAPPTLAAALGAAALLPLLAGGPANAAGWAAFLRLLGAPDLPGAPTLALASLALPAVALPLALALRAVPRDLRRAATANGAPPGVILRRLLWPRVRRPLLLGLGAAFALAAGDASAPALLAPEAPALADRIARHARDPAGPDLAAAVATLLLALLAAVLLLARLLAGRPAR